MASLTKALQEEIRRVLRRETASLRKAQAAEIKELQKLVRELARRVKAAEKAAASSAKAGTGKRRGRPAKPKPAAKKKPRVTGKTIKRLRSKLKLSQGELGALLGVTGQSVYQWERKDAAPIRLRNTTREALAQIEGIGAREARKRIEALG